MGKLMDMLEEIGKQPMEEQQLLQKGLSLLSRSGAKNDLSANAEKDGISVVTDNDRHIVTTPNNYDVYWELNRRDRDTQRPYAERMSSDDKSKAVFAVSSAQLSSDGAIKDFNTKISNARATNAALIKERDDLEYQIAFDHSNGKQAVFVYKNPSSGFATGEVLKAGKFFVAVTAGENEDKKYFRVINTSRLLEGKEFADRESAILEKMPIGSKKYIKFTDNGRVNVQDYTAKAEQKAPVTEKALEQPVVPGQLSKAQLEAVMAVRESNPKAWKRDLAAMWTTGNYKGMESSQAALLQQVRNTQGPEWLAKVTAKELHGIVDEPAVKAAKAKTMQMAM